MKTIAMFPRSVTKDRLVALARQSPGAWMGVKIAALLLVLEGKRPSWIADALGVTRMSLHRWVRAVETQGVAALSSKPRPGRPCQLTPPLAQRLHQCLARSPEAVGLPRARWNGPMLVEYLRRHCGLTLKVRQAQHWLHRLGYQLKRANHVDLQAVPPRGSAFDGR
jgi:transposase